MPTSDEYFKKNNFEQTIKSILDERQLILSGSCNQCGLCCEHGNMHFKWNDKSVDFVDFSNEICDAYDKENKKCTVHDKDKPLVCKLYPYTPESIPDNIQCGYEFLKKEQCEKTI